jgi:hypothetical protein
MFCKVTPMDGSTPIASAYATALASITRTGVLTTPLMELDIEPIDDKLTKLVGDQESIVEADRCRRKLLGLINLVRSEPTVQLENAELISAAIGRTRSAKFWTQHTSSTGWKLFDIFQKRVTRLSDRDKG